jgi:thiol-disulfide isomerase/thioredoxin
MRFRAFSFVLVSVGSRVQPMAAFQSPAARRQHVQVAAVTRCWMASVSGTAYTSETKGTPTVKLFTKEGCTLCDKVKEVLVEMRDEYPHSLEQVDITDDGNEDWFSKYKYDIPVLHMGDRYWIKHRMDVAEAKMGLTEATEGDFKSRDGEPDAGATEKRQAERQQQN